MAATGVPLAIHHHKHMYQRDTQIKNSLWPFKSLCPGESITCSPYTLHTPCIAACWIHPDPPRLTLQEQGDQRGTPETARGARARIHRRLGQEEGAG